MEGQRDGGGVSAWKQPAAQETGNAATSHTDRGSGAGAQTTEGKLTLTIDPCLHSASPIWTTPITKEVAGPDITCQH